MLLYKRIFAIVFSAAALVVSLPVQAAIALAIWLDSGTPIFYCHSRVGKDGKQFILYKFRSMHVEGNREHRHRPAEVNDDRCTRIGRWLRRLRLDELPQLYNILRGDMDFVGPRPFVPDQEEELVKTIPNYQQRWAVKPGATGWAQVHFHYCFSIEDNAEKLGYDLFYIKNMSIGLDLLILFMTFKILLLGRGGR